MLILLLWNHLVGQGYVYQCVAPALLLTTLLGTDNINCCAFDGRCEAYVTSNLFIWNSISAAFTDV